MDPVLFANFGSSQEMPLRREVSTSPSLGPRLEALHAAAEKIAKANPQKSYFEALEEALAALESGENEAEAVARQVEEILADPQKIDREARELMRKNPALSYSAAVELVVEGM